MTSCVALPQQVFIKVTRAATKGRPIEPESMKKQLVRRRDDTDVDTDDELDMNGGRAGHAVDTMPGTPTS